MGKILLQLFLLVIGGIVFIPLFVVGVLYTFGKHVCRWDYSPVKQIVPVLRNIVLVLDGLANAGAGELLNDAFKIKGIIRYGRWNQTISAVTGLIYTYVKDTRFRRTLDKVLGKNHCTDAITEQDNYYYKNNK